MALLSTTRGRRQKGVAGRVRDTVILNGTVKLTRLWADEASWPDVKRPLRKGIGVHGPLVSRRFRVNLTVPSHAIAASLGYSHGTPGRDICARLLANRELTVSCPGHGVTQPTPFDVLHGAVLYGRGAGTRHPDRDQYPLSE